MGDPVQATPAQPEKPSRRSKSFRSSKDARTASFAWLQGLTEESSWEYLKALRFRANDGEPWCTHCGIIKVYPIKKRHGWWVCSDPECKKQFSVTSGTILHGRKLSYVKLVRLVYDFAAAAKGVPALELCLRYESAYRTVWMTLMKLREAMASRRDDVALEGEVEMDAAWFGGKARPKNLAADRRKKENDRRNAEFQRGKRPLMVARQRNGDSVMFAADDESAAVANATLRTVMRGGEC
jgi:hypothetical protein